MKILIVRNFPSYVNIKFKTYNIQEVGLAKALVRKGHECDLICWTNKEEADEEIIVDQTKVINIFYRKGITFLKMTIYTHLDDLAKKYDIVQLWEYNQIQANFYSRKYPDKSIIYHGSYFSPFNKRYNLMCKVFDMLFLKRYIKNNVKFITKSLLAKNFLTDKGIPTVNVCVAGVGIDLEMIESNNICDVPLYEKMCEQGDNLKILYVGKFEARRNLFFIIDVFKNIHMQIPSARLYLVGKGAQEYMDSVFEYAKEQNIFEYIVWQNVIEQELLSPIYRKADFFLLPTEYDIFGMVLLEAMYYQTVVLTTNNGGSVTLIENGKSGLVFEEKNAKVWAQNVIDIYADKSYMEQIKMNAYNKINEEFTWDMLANKFIEQYENLIANKKTEKF